MRARIPAVAAAVCSTFLISSLAVQPAHAQVVNLKISNFFPPPSQQSKVVEAFGKALESKSGGKIKVQYFAGGSLVQAPAMFKGIESGITDVGYSHVYYTPGRMPVNTILISLSGRLPDSRIMRRARSRIFTGSPMSST